MDGRPGLPPWEVEPRFAPEAWQTHTTALSSVGNDASFKNFHCDLLTSILFLQFPFLKGVRSGLPPCKGDGYGGLGGRPRLVLVGTSGARIGAALTERANQLLDPRRMSGCRKCERIPTPSRAVSVHGGLFRSDGRE